MTERYQISAPLPYTNNQGEEKTAWLNCGIAFSDKSGEGYTLFLDGFPCPQYDRERKQMRYKLRMAPARLEEGPRKGAPSYDKDPMDIPY